jgi:hypothetical protein
MFVDGCLLLVIFSLDQMSTWAALILEHSSMVLSVIVAEALY